LQGRVVGVEASCIGGRLLRRRELDGLANHAQRWIERGLRQHLIEEYEPSSEQAGFFELAFAEVGVVTQVGQIPGGELTSSEFDVVALQVSGGAEAPIEVIGGGLASRASRERRCSDDE